MVNFGGSRLGGTTRATDGSTAWRAIHFQNSMRQQKGNENFRALHILHTVLHVFVCLICSISVGHPLILMYLACFGVFHFFIEEAAACRLPLAVGSGLFESWLSARVLHLPLS